MELCAHFNRLMTNGICKHIFSVALALSLTHSFLLIYTHVWEKIPNEMDTKIYISSQWPYFRLRLGWKKPYEHFAERICPSPTILRQWGIFRWQKPECMYFVCGAAAAAVRYTYITHTNHPKNKNRKYCHILFHFDRWTERERTERAQEQWVMLVILSDNGLSVGT